MPFTLFIIASLAGKYFYIDPVHANYIKKQSMLKIFLDANFETKILSEKYTFSTGIETRISTNRVVHLYTDFVSVVVEHVLASKRHFTQLRERPPIL